MSLIERLSEFLRRRDTREPAERQAQLTVAMLLALVARIDGRLLAVEEERLRALLSTRFGLSPDAAARLIGEAVALDGGLDPASALAERIGQDVAPAERPALLALAYRMAAADGQVHEFEDDLLWRLGHLLGLDEHAIAAIRDDALAGANRPEG